MPRNHIVISGTGRTGTTFLVELLSNLGLQTGLQESVLSPKNKIANAGLEYDIRKDDAPYIVKNPHFCDYVTEVLGRQDIVIEHVFIPMRNLGEAAESRRYVTKLNVSEIPLKRRLKIAVKRLFKSHTAKVYSGGLWATSKKEEQELVLLQKNYSLMLALSDSFIPVTLINYPRHVTDSGYLYRKLQPILHDITYSRFVEVYNATVQPQLVHSFKE